MDSAIKQKKKLLHENPMWLHDFVEGKASAPAHESYSDLKAFKYYWESWRNIHNESDDKFNINFTKDLVLRKGMSISPELLMEQIKEDSVSINVLFQSKEQHLHPLTRYYVSRPLSETLNEAVLDLSTEHFLEKFSGYIEFNYPVLDKEGKRLVGCFVYTGIADRKMSTIQKGDRYIRMTAVIHEGNTYAWSRVNVPLGPKKLIRDIITKDYDYKEVYMGGVVAEHEATYEHWHHMVLSTLAYISGGNHELNDIVDSTLKNDANLGYFRSENIPTSTRTLRPYVLLGRDFHHQWEQKDGIVRGHWKTQPHGPYNSLRKLIFRDEYSTTIWSKVAKN